MLLNKIEDLSSREVLKQQQTVLELWDFLELDNQRRWRGTCLLLKKYEISPLILNLKRYMAFNVF